MKSHDCRSCRSDGITSVNKSITIEDIFEDMMRSGSTVTKAEGLAVFEELCMAIEKLVKEGNQ
jgi:hypothetical protein